MNNFTDADQQEYADASKRDTDDHNRVVVHQLTERELLEEIVRIGRAFQDGLEVLYNHAKTNPMLSAFLPDL